MQAESSTYGTNEVHQGPTSPSSMAPSCTSPSCHLSSSQSKDSATVSHPCGTMDFENSAVCSLNMGRTVEENGVDEDDYGPDDEESCCEGESDVDEDLFVKAHQSRGSVGSLRDNKGIRLPLDDIHGSSNALQIHDNHTLPLSLHHNRQSSGSNGETCSGGVSQPSFLNLSPPCGTALPGTMFRLRFVGSLEVDEEIGSGKRRRKRSKKLMVEEAVMKLKVGGLYCFNIIRLFKCIAQCC